MKNWRYENNEATNEVNTLPQQRYQENGDKEPEAMAISEVR